MKKTAYVLLLLLISIVIINKAMESITLLPNKFEKQPITTLRIWSPSKNQYISSIMVDQSLTIGELKQTLKEIFGAPLNKQHLFAIQLLESTGQTFPSAELVDHANTQNVMQRYDTDTFMLNIDPTHLLGK